MTIFRLPFAFFRLFCLFSLAMLVLFLPLSAEEVIYYSVTFDITEKAERAGGGQLVQNVANGHSAWVPEIATIEGWVFIGWDSHDFREVTEDVVVKAEFAPVAEVEFVESELLDIDSVIGDHFGSSIGLSGDTLVVGAPNEGNGSIQGLAYVYELIDNTWVKESTLIGSDAGISDYFGKCVSISGDTLVVGTYAKDSYAGAVYVFSRIDGAWEESVKLIPSNTVAHQRFGTSVHVKGDTIVVGSPGDSSRGIESSVFVFARQNGEWIEQAILDESSINEGSQIFGSDVYTNGDVVLVSDPTLGSSNETSVFVFRRVDDQWLWEDELIFSSPYFYGQSLAMHQGRILVGLGYANSGIGAVHVYEKIESVWQEVQRLTPSEHGAYGSFGATLVVDGNFLLVGDPYELSSGDEYGRAFLYEDVDGLWVEQRVIVPSSAVSEDFWGFSVGMSGDKIALGQYPHGDRQNSVYLFDSRNDYSTVVFELGGYGTRIHGGELEQTIRNGESADAPVIGVFDDWAFIGWDEDYHNVTVDLTVYAEYIADSLVGVLSQPLEPNTVLDDLGWSVAIHGGTAVVGARSSGAAFVFVNQNGEWIEQTKLIASDSDVIGNFGGAVSIYGDTIVVGAEGAAYVFERSGVIWSEVAKLIPDASYNDYGFGSAVSVFEGRIAVGAQYAARESVASGVLYVFERDVLGDWEESEQLFPSDGVDHLYFGWSVSLSEGSLAVGAPGDDTGGNAAGSVYLFSYNGSEWLQDAKLYADDADAYYRFGVSVSLSGDVLLVGAPCEDAVPDINGKAYLFRLFEGTWGQAQMIQSPSSKEEGTRFGESVSVSGEFAVVGSFGEDECYLYRIGGSLERVLSLDEIAHGSWYGYSVGISGDQVIVGAPYAKNSSSETVGSVHVFDIGSPQMEIEFNLGVIGSRVGGGAMTQTVTAGSSVVAPVVDATEGWFFEGWDRDIAVINGAGMINAVYSAIHTVTFVIDPQGSRVGGGELVQPVVHGRMADLPVFDISEGWVLERWNGDFREITGDVTVTAQYAKAYTVTFNAGVHGTIEVAGGTQVVAVGGAAIAPIVASDEGWEFVGWDRHYHDVSESIIVTAQYAPIELVGTLEEKLRGNDVDLYDYNGEAISLDGDTLLVGSSGDDDLGSSSGSAYVFVRENGIWSQKAKLTAIDGERFDRFGSAVALSGDTAVVGAPNADNLGYADGSIYVFVRRNGAWSLETKLTASDGKPADQFGSSLSLHGDTLVVGAPGDDDDGRGRRSVGGVYVYTRSGEIWAETAKLQSSDGLDSDQFGTSVAIDQNQILVGAPSALVGGAAYIYKKAEGGWIEDSKLFVTATVEGDGFGDSVSLSGSHALIGARLNNAWQGAAYLFTCEGGVWDAGVELVADSLVGNSRYGSSVSINHDTAVVGAPYDDGEGSVYVFQKSADVWSIADKLIASDVESNDQFGAAVSVDADMVAVGVPYEDGRGTNSGSFYLYDLGTPPLNVTFHLDGKADRSGGGELNQLVKMSTAASAPILSYEPGWVFDSWETDFYSVKTDLSVKALYRYDSVNEDGDALWDGWELVHFGATNFTDGTIDSDGDGYLDEDEFIAGSDPQDRTDFFHVLEQEVSQMYDYREVRLCFPTNDDISGRRYRIWSTDDLNANSWQDESGDISPDAGDSMQLHIYVPVSEDVYFFKVEAFIEE